MDGESECVRVCVCVCVCVCMYVCVSGGQIVFYVNIISTYNKAVTL